MKTETWRDRLAAAVSASGRSMRSISLGAGLGKGYVHSILKEGKDPTIDNLIAVCRESGVSLSSVLYGFEISAETEEILALLEQNPQMRAGMLDILRSQSAA